MVEGESTRGPKGGQRVADGICKESEVGSQRRLDGKLQPGYEDAKI